VKCAKIIYSNKVINDLSKLDGNDSKPFWDYLKKVKHAKGSTAPHENIISGLLILKKCFHNQQH
jgi:hypothetical protein